MSHNRHSTSYSFERTFRKFFLSAFVILSFAAYALHKSITSADVSLGQANLAPTAQESQPTSTPVSPLNTGLQSGTNPQQATGQQPLLAQPTATQPQQQASGQYKNGTYTGSQVDAFYGLVQVQTTIQNGKIASVQFLQYPNDRRTSVRINTFAVPQLQQEAVQAQQANVDIVTGATLTSQAFMMSLQSALDQATN